MQFFLGIISAALKHANIIYLNISHTLHTTKFMLFPYRNINFGNACHLISNRLEIKIPLDLMKANKSLVALLPNSCTPRGTAVLRCSGPLSLEQLKSLLDPGGSQKENPSMESWYIPLLLVILTITNILWTMKTYVPFWISIKKNISNRKINLLFTYTLHSTPCWHLLSSLFFFLWI